MRLCVYIFVCVFWILLYKVFVYSIIYLVILQYVNRIIYSLMHILAYQSNNLYIYHISIYLLTFLRNDLSLHLFTYLIIYLLAYSNVFTFDWLPPQVYHKGPLETVHLCLPYPRAGPKDKGLTANINQHPVWSWSAVVIFILWFNYILLNFIPFYLIVLYDNMFLWTMCEGFCSVRLSVLSHLLFTHIIQSEVIY